MCLKERRLNRHLMLHGPGFTAPRHGPCWENGPCRSFLLTSTAHLLLLSSIDTFTWPMGEASLFTNYFHSQDFIYLEIVWNITLNTVLLFVAFGIILWPHDHIHFLSLFRRRGVFADCNQHCRQYHCIAVHQWITNHVWFSIPSKSGTLLFLLR